MRAIDWLPGTLAGMALCVAAIFMVALPLFLADDTFPRTSYVGSAEKAFEKHGSESAQKGNGCPGSECAAVAEVTCPPAYCDYFTSPAEQLYNVLGFVAAFLLSGAIGARLGPTIEPWRGALANGLALLGLFVVAGGVRGGTDIENAVIGGVLILVGTALGYLSGYVVKRWARKTSAAHAGP